MQEDGPQDGMDEGSLILVRVGEGAEPLQPVRQLVVGGWLVQGGPILRIDHADVIRLPQPPDILWIVQGALGDQPVDLQQPFGRERFVLEPLDGPHGAEIVADHPLASIPWGPALPEHRRGDFPGRGGPFQLAGGDGFLDQGTKEVVVPVSWWRQLGRGEDSSRRVLVDVVQVDLHGLGGAEHEGVPRLVPQGQGLRQALPDPLDSLPPLFMGQSFGRIPVPQLIPVWILAVDGD